MASMGMELLASALCLLGWAGIIISCILPMWRVTAFVGTTIITSQTMWEGIWMACVVQSTGVIQCKPYESVLALNSEMQASRSLIALAIATGAAGLILAFIGGKCTRFLDEEGERVKGKVAVAAGAVLITTGVLCLIPTSWVAGVVVSEFYSTTVDAEKREIGACLYIGWGASILLILGGGLFISSVWPLKAHDTDKSPSVRYLVVRSSKGSSQAGFHHSRVPSAQSQPITAVFTQSPHYGGPSMKSQLDTRPPWENIPKEERKQDSDRSWALSTKSEMKTPQSTESEHSEAPSTKSQLEQAVMVNNSSVKSDHKEESSNPARTYL